jgi:fructan beta-fructosidase
MKQLSFLLLLSLLFACAKKDQTKSNHYYTEKYRPQFHFSPEKGWMNDPNGLLYVDGEYHLFYQHFPDSTVWGPMHWGHAVSKDLVTWEHLPIALTPDSIGCIFSGSAVLDEHNTAGFATAECPKPMVAIFTYHNLEWEKAGRKDRESQGIAYSLDKGRTWTKYAGNPVLKNKGDVDFRDPKVFWHEPTKHWIMPLAVGDYLEIFASPDLKNWTKTSTFGQNEGAHGGVWECPDLFPMGDKWVLVQNMGRGAVNGGSGTQYFVGDFDGKIFKNSNPPNQVLWVDYGADNYAGVTWANAPNNRRISIGWMSNWDDYAQKTPTSTWRSHLTVPREFTLQNTENGLRLFQVPVPELAILRQTTIKLDDNQVVENELVVKNNAVQKDINLTFDMEKTTSQNFGFTLSNSKDEWVEIGYDKSKNELYVDRTKSGKVGFSDKFPKRHVAPLVLGKTLKIRALVDVSSIEIFADDGKIAISELFFPNEDFTTLRIFSRKGVCMLKEGKVYGMKGIWK